MERLKAKKPRFRQLKRIGTMALAATIALSVPAVSNVVEKVNPLSSSVVSAAEEQTNLMNSDEILTNFNNVHNESDEHWTHHFHNSGDMKVDRLDFGSKDLEDLKYVVKFPEELSHLLEDEYVLDYLFGKVTNFDSAQNPFTFTGEVFDDHGTLITVAKDEHKPYEHISINKDTNSIEFDFASFYEANNLEPYVRQNVDGEFIFNTLGFTTSIVVPDERMLYNGDYEFKSAYVRGTSVDLDNVSNAYSEILKVEYSTDPEPEPEPEPEEPEVPEADKDELAALLTDAEEYDPEDYTEASYDVFATAAGDALAVFENEDATQEEVDEAVANLEEAIAGLVEVDEPEEPEEVDTSDLEELVEEANGFDAEDYTEESFAALTAAIVVAEEILADEEATEEQVNNALDILQTAIDELDAIEEPTPEPEPETDVSELKEAVEEAEGYDAEEYTEASFAALVAALDKAEAVLANEEATQEEVDTALEELDTAIEGLEEVVEPTPEPEPEVEKSDLENAIATAVDYDAEDYTEASFAALTVAVETAEAVLENEKATQDEVDTALEDLESAIAGLEKDEPKTETPTEDEDVEIIDDGSDDTSEEGEGNILPETATSTFNMMLIGFLVLLAGCGSLFFRKKKA